MNEQRDFKSTLGRLKSRGYWRIEFHPSTFEEDVISLADCKQLISEASIKLRGWDVPHIPVNGRDDKQDMYPKDSNRYESWIDWHIFKEVWRFYRSGKLTFLKNITENWYDEFEWATNPLPNLEPNSVVDTIDSIYTLTEFMLLFRNIAIKLPTVKRWTINISLNNTNGQKLGVLDKSRIPLSWDYINHTDKINVIRTEVSNTDLKNTNYALGLAKDAARTLFENFEFQVADSLLDGEQDKLVNRRF